MTEFSWAEPSPEIRAEFADREIRKGIAHPAADLSTHLIINAANSPAQLVGMLAGVYAVTQTAMNKLREAQGTELITNEEFDTVFTEVLSYCRKAHK